MHKRFCCSDKISQPHVRHHWMRENAKESPNIRGIAQKQRKNTHKKNSFDFYVCSPMTSFQWQNYKSFTLRCDEADDHLNTFQFYKYKTLFTIRIGYVAYGAVYFLSRSVQCDAKNKMISNSMAVSLIHCPSSVLLCSDNDQIRGEGDKSVQILYTVHRILLSLWFKRRRSRQKNLV